MSFDDLRRSSRVAGAAASRRSASIQPDCSMESLNSGSSSVLLVETRKRRGKRKSIEIVHDESDTSDNEGDSETYSESSEEESMKKGKQTQAKAKGKVSKAKRQKGSKSIKRKSKSPSKRSLDKTKVGTESDLKCPYCNKIFSVLHGLAYHLERRVCQRVTVDVDADGIESHVSKVYGRLLPGEKFVTSYGVVQVVADDRPDDCDLNEKSAPHIPEKRRDSVMRRKNRILMAAAKYQRRRRNKFIELFRENVTGERLQAEIWKEYCPSATPADILAGSWSWKTKKTSSTDEADKQVLTSADVSGDRIVTCELINDERRKVTEINHDVQDETGSTKIDIVKASVEKAKEEALQMILNRSHDITVPTLRTHISGMKLYLQRRLLCERYNDKIPIFECIRCGRCFSSRAGLKGHLQEKVCEKKVDQLIKERLERLEMIEKGLDEPFANEPPKDKKQPGATIVVGNRKIKASVFKKLPGWIVFKHNRSSIYPEVFERLKFKRGSNNSNFLQKKWAAIGPGRRRVRNRKRKGMKPPVEGGEAITEKRTRRYMKSSGDEGDDSDLDDYSEYSSSDESLLNDTGMSFVDQVSDNESGMKMPPLPVCTYPIPNAFEIPVPFHAGAETSSKSDLVLNDTMEQKLSSKTVAKRKVPTKSQPKAITKSTSRTVEKRSVAETPTASLEEPGAPVKPPVKQRKARKANANIDKRQEPENTSSLAVKHKVSAKASSSSIVVDPSVFVEEIHAGRYPSIKVYNGEHLDYCLICKKNVDQVFNCEFCSNAEHIECLKTKVNIRDFEPDDEFMCHKCIQTILSRRARAQKRRLQKLDERLGTQNEENPLPSLADPLSIVLDETVESSAKTEVFLPPIDSGMATTTTSDLAIMDSNIGASKLFSCPIGGPGGLICCDVCTASYSKMLSQTEKEHEIQMVSKIGQEVSELMELLTDAQIRLQQALDASKGNDKRRGLLASSDGISTLETLGNS